jgi:hypothetical protein
MRHAPFSEVLVIEAQGADEASDEIPAMAIIPACEYHADERRLC